MILNGNRLRLGSTSLQLAKEKSCTLTISSSSTKIAQSAERSTRSIPILNSWEVKAQLLFTWATLLALMLQYIHSSSPSSWKIEGDTTEDVHRETKWTFSGRGFLTRIQFAAQGVGLVSINITIKGTGKPTWQTESRVRSFVLGTSLIGSDALI